MSSKAFFKSSVEPQLIYRCVKNKSINNNIKRRVIEVWTTTCIVTNFGKTTGTKSSNCSVLINPSNPELSGVKNFPYFPRGGPVPKEKPMSSMHKEWQPLGYVSQWGGMDVGSGMLYPVSVVDGLVHQLGGLQLESIIAMKRMMTSLGGGNKELCPIGKAFQTIATDKLNNHYDYIIHTTPPFYKHYDGDGNPEKALQSCYREAFNLAFSTTTATSSINNNNGIETKRVASPLIGAGARGFPENLATRIAASESIHWMTNKNDNDHYIDQQESNNKEEKEDIVKEEEVIAFGLLEQRIAEDLAELIEGKR